MAPNSGVRRILVRHNFGNLFIIDILNFITDHQFVFKVEFHITLINANKTSIL